MSAADLARHEGRPDSDAGVLRADDMAAAHVAIHNLFPEHNWSQPLTDTQWLQVETAQLQAQAAAAAGAGEAATAVAEGELHETKTEMEIGETNRFVETPTRSTTPWLRTTLPPPTITTGARPRPASSRRRTARSSEMQPTADSPT